MGIVKEPLHIDFVVENRPLTKAEEKQISDYITSQRKKGELKHNASARTLKNKQKAN